MSEELNEVAPATSEGQEPELEITLDDTTDEETVESLKEQLAKEQEARRQLTARAKIAEEKLKATPAPVKVNPPTLNNGIDEVTIEKKILKSQGMSDELLEELVALSKVRGKGLLDTQSDPIFIALKESKEAETKKSKASMGASKGSGTAKKDKTFNTPGLTEEEHKEMWKSSQGR